MFCTKSPKTSYPFAAETCRKSGFHRIIPHSFSSQDPTVENLQPSAELFESPSAEKLPPQRWHFPRLCDNSTRVPHPYKIQLLRSSLAGKSQPSISRDDFFVAPSHTATGCDTLSV